jgi:xanthine dehydrogenase accessory factor
MKNIITWKLIKSSLEQQIPVMLLYVLESLGSSPGRRGFFMAVNDNGDMEGSIGGGIMEHKFVEMAREKLKAGSRESGVKKQVHDKTTGKNQSGMICSGEQSILLYTVQPGDSVTIEQIISSLHDHKNGTLVLSPEGIFFESTAPSTDFDFVFRSEKDWLYKEKTGYKNHLFIIGGGHCSLALSSIMKTMDYYIRVYDDRMNLKTMQENDSAHEKHLIDDYKQLGNMISSGENHYVVIMTFGYRSDDIAVKALLDKQFKFLGLLGSKTKIEKMFAGYREEGIKEEWLQGIHTPVGLQIKSQTPEEIAVSIAAEIIKIKNQ